MNRDEMKRDEILALICDTIRQFGHTGEQTAPLMIDENTVIFGDEGILDSLSLLNVVNVLEQELEERYNVKLALTEPEEMAADRNPLQSLGGLADYILGVDPPVPTPRQVSQKKVYLRAFEPADYHRINVWRQDEEIYRLTVGNRRFVSSERDRQWVLDKIANNVTEDYLAICLKETETMIGYISLSNIDYRNSRAYWSGIVIGDKEYQGQGYASQAIYLLLEYAFDELGLHRVLGEWLPQHKVSLFLAKMMGFRQEGLLREYVYKGGKRHDLILMSILKPEFEQLRERFGGAVAEALTWEPNT